MSPEAVQRVGDSDSSLESRRKRRLQNFASTLYARRYISAIGTQDNIDFRPAFSERTDQLS